MNNTKCYAPVQTLKNQRILLNNEQLIYITGSGVSSFNIQTGQQQFTKLSDKNFKLIQHYQQNILLVDQLNNIVIYSYAGNSFELLHQFQVNDIIINAKLNKNQVVAHSLTKVYIINISTQDIQQFNSEMVESMDLYQNVLVLGLTDNSVRIINTLDIQIQTCTQIGLASGNEAKSAISAVSMCLKQQVLYLLVSQLYGASKLFIIDDNNFDLQLIFTVSETFFAQTLTNQITNNYLLIAGQNKKINVFDYNNFRVAQLGVEFDGGRGIMDILVNDKNNNTSEKLSLSSLIISVITEGNNHFLIKQSETQNFIKLNHQITTIPGTSSKQSIKLLNDKYLLKCCGSQITIHDADTLFNLEIAVQNGCDIYCLDTIDEGTFLFGGDEAVLRIVQVPLQFYVNQKANLKNLASQSHCKHDILFLLITGSYPICGESHALDPSVTPIYQICQFDHNFCLIMNEHLKKLFVSSDQLSFQYQFGQFACFAEISQVVGFGGANVQKIAVNRLQKDIVVLGATDRLDEPSFEVRDLVLKTTKLKLIGQFQDFYVDAINNFIYIIDKFGQISIIDDKYQVQNLTYKLQVSLGAKCQISMLKNYAIVITYANTLCFANENAIQNSIQLDCQISKILSINNLVIIGFDNGQLISISQQNMKTQLAQLSGKITDIIYSKNKNQLYICDINGLIFKLAYIK